MRLLKSIFLLIAIFPSSLCFAQEKLKSRPQNQDKACIIDFNGDGTIEVVKLKPDICQTYGGAVASYAGFNQQIASYTINKKNYKLTEKSIQNIETTSSNVPITTELSNDQSATYKQNAFESRIKFPIPVEPGKISNDVLDRLKKLPQKVPDLLKPYEDQHICWNYADEAERADPEFNTFTLFICCSEKLVRPRAIIQNTTNRIISPEDRKVRAKWQATEPLLSHAINDIHYTNGNIKFFEPQFLRQLDKNLDPQKLEVNLDKNGNGLVETIEISHQHPNRTVCLNASYESYNDARQFFDQTYGAGTADSVFLPTNRSGNGGSINGSCLDLLSQKLTHNRHVAALSPELKASLENGELARLLKD